MKVISKINPMVRAVGTMGAIAAVVGGVTFAQLTSNTVALSPNSVTVGSAQLSIGTDCSAEAATTTIPGFNVDNLSLSNPATVNFCLTNNGDVDLALTGDVPEDLSASAVAQNTTLTVDCGLGTPLTSTLDNWGPGNFTNPLAAGDTAECTATIALKDTYNGPGGASIPAFSIKFFGTEVTPAP